MNSSADKNRIALLIDGENTDASYAVGIIRTIGRLGQIQIGTMPAWDAPRTSEEKMSPT